MGQYKNMLAQNGVTQINVDMFPAHKKIIPYFQMHLQTKP